MAGESFAVLIVEPGRARICRFNVELRGETLWTTTTEQLVARLRDARPEIVAVADRAEVATELAEELRRRGLAQSVFVMTPAGEGEPAPTGQIRVVLPQGAARMKPEGLLQQLVRSVLAAQARTPVSALTGLPGSPVLRSDIERRLAGGDPFVFLYLDIDNFKAYNDVYGFGRGDIAIRLLGRAVRGATQELGSPRDLCVHIGGDDFAIVTTAEHSRAVVDKIIAEFDAGVPDLYSEQDRARGHIETASRRGAPERYPLMTVSIGGVSTTRRRVGSYLELAEIAAEVKSYAKALEGSRFVMDSRRA
jgi:diguanylate cyclase (GGDEF)-like protein